MDEIDGRATMAGVGQAVDDVTAAANGAFEVEGDAPVPTAAEKFRAGLREDPAVARALLVAEQSAETEVVDVVSRDSVSGALVVIRAGVKRVEEIRKGATKPLRDAVAVLSAAAEEVAAGLKQVDEALDKRLGTWLASEQVLATQVSAKAAEAAAQAAIEAGHTGLPVEVYVAPPPKSVRVEGAQVVSTTRWTYRVVDAALVPREFCEPSSRLLGAAVRGGKRYIPGVVIEATDKQSIRPGG